MKSLIGIWPNAPNIKPNAIAKATPSTCPGIKEKKTNWTVATIINTGRGPKRSSDNPTANWAIDAMAKTINANEPMTVATSPCPDAPTLSVHWDKFSARPCRRSSNIFGSANVVDWKTTDDTAVVRNTIAETRKTKVRCDGDCFTSEVDGSCFFVVWSKWMSFHVNAI